jgi:carbon-monoxide dehydrogenase medium subunit
MYPASFEYSAPSSVDEAVSLLSQHGEDAKVLAGGHSLLPLMKLRFAQPSRLIDLRRVAALVGVHREKDVLVVGAMTTHAAIASSPDVRDALPILADAASQIGDPQVRNRGTIGGSLAHADPGADLPAVMLATEARVTVVSATGTRTIQAADLFVGLLKSALAQGELITEIRIPLPAARSGGAYTKHVHPASRYADVGVAATITLARKGDTIERARVGVTGLGTHAVRAVMTEALLVGRAPEKQTLQDAASTVADEIQPRDGLEEDKAYLAQLTRVYAERAFVKAVERAR